MTKFLYEKLNGTAPQLTTLIQNLTIILRNRKTGW